MASDAYTQTRYYFSTCLVFPFTAKFQALLVSHPTFIVDSMKNSLVSVKKETNTETQSGLGKHGCMYEDHIRSFSLCVRL